MTSQTILSTFQTLHYIFLWPFRAHLYSTFVDICWHTPTPSHWSVVHFEKDKKPWLKRWKLIKLLAFVRQWQHIGHQRAALGESWRRGPRLACASRLAAAAAAPWQAERGLTHHGCATVNVYVEILKCSTPFLWWGLERICMSRHERHSGEY